MTRIIIRREIWVPRKPFLRPAFALAPWMSRNLVKAEGEVPAGSEFRAEACIKFGVGQMKPSIKTSPAVENWSCV